jgi:hypothetical protein
MWPNNYWGGGGGDHLNIINPCVPVFQDVTFQELSHPNFWFIYFICLLP